MAKIRVPRTAKSKRRPPKLPKTSEFQRIGTPARNRSPYGKGYNKSGTPKMPKGANMGGTKRVGVSKSGGAKAPGVAKALRIDSARHGAGIVYTPRGPVIAVVMSYDDRGVSLSQGRALGSRVAALAVGAQG